jgi:hypothetical protein
MAHGAQNVIQHGFQLPRIVSSTDNELEALYAILVSLSATKMMAQRQQGDNLELRIGGPLDWATA